MSKEAIEKLSSAIAMISELLVDVSKSHISKDDCIEGIRKQMNVVNNDEVYQLLFPSRRSKPIKTEPDIFEENVLLKSKIESVRYQFGIWRPDTHADHVLVDRIKEIIGEWNVDVKWAQLNMQNY